MPELKKTERLDAQFGSFMDTSDKLSRVTAIIGKTGVMRLSSVDLPALGAPISAMKPLRRPALTIPGP